MSSRHLSHDFPLQKGRKEVTRFLKVFAKHDEQELLSERVRLIASYAAFAVIEATPSKTKDLQRDWPCEDITSRYAIPIRGKSKVPSATSTNSNGKNRTAGAAPSGGKHHYLVQFVGPIKKQWLSRITRLGGELRELYRDFTYIVRLNQKMVGEVSALSFVRWVGHLPYEDRISIHLRQRYSSSNSRLPRTRLRTGVYTVQIFNPRDMNSIAAEARQLGFRILSSSPSARTLVVQSQENLSAPSRMLRTLTTIHGVKFIRARPIKRISNDVAATLMGTTRVMASGRLGLSGRGEVLAICDTGLDTGDRKDLHPDFHRRVIAIKSYPVAGEWAKDVFNPGGNDGAADLDSGHGTHVAGSAVGDGSASRGVTAKPVRGLAHRARLVFQAVEQEMWWRPHVPKSDRERYSLSGLPADVTEIFSYAYRKKARIHSNSWGGGDPGAYDEQCEQLDRFVWKHEDFCVLASAGNDGSDRDRDGQINLMSVSSPATAKNCISIGASESRRPQFKDDTYGSWWEDDFPVSPYRRDPMANNPDQVVAFSSRGPTEDQRTKPDLLAPGTFILSTRSSMIATNNFGWQAFPPSKDYFFQGGTSMATPLAAGAAALVREYLRRHGKIRVPSAALVKAVLIAGARRLPGMLSGQTSDNHQGFGRIDLDSVLSSRALFRQISPGLRTGELFSMNIAVRANTSRLRITLAYSDYPGPSLVNDLNLILTSPGGRKHTSAGAAKTGALKLDSKNNVEVVEIRAPKAGQWRIDVVGSNVPQGPQGFALVTLGA